MVVAAVEAGEIDRLVRGVRAGALSVDDALTTLSTLAEGRGSTAARRRDGAFFTATDVSEWLARRAIVCAVADGLGIERFDLALREGGDDLHAALEVELAAFVAAGDRSAPCRALAVLTSLQVLDPTCGAGALLAAALRELVALEQLLHRCARATSRDLSWRSLRVSLEQLHGIDVDPVAIRACSAALELTALDLGRDATSAPGRGDPELVIADVLEVPIREAMPRLDATGGADVVLGNPPFVRAPAMAAPSDLAAAGAGNVAAWVLERAVQAASDRGARLALVLPISAACTTGWTPVRALWHRTMSSAWASHFDSIPATLFPGVVQRITLLEGRRRPRVQDARTPASCSWHSTTYHRWLGAERLGLLERVRFAALPGYDGASSLPKVGTELELGLLGRIHAQPAAARLLDLARRGVRPGDPGSIAYKRRWSYFLLFTDFVPGIWDEHGEAREPTELKAIAAAGGVDPSALIAIFSSTLFWWYFSAFTDNRNVNVRDLAAFPVPPLGEGRMRRLAEMGTRLMEELHACAEVRTCTYESVGTIRNTYFRQGATRPMLDVIDRELAEAYGIQQRELDFVLGFERRFRS